MRTDCYPIRGACTQRDHQAGSLSQPSEVHSQSTASAPPIDQLPAASLCNRVGLIAMESGIGSELVPSAFFRVSFSALAPAFDCRGFCGAFIDRNRYFQSIANGLLRSHHLNGTSCIPVAGSICQDFELTRSRGLSTCQVEVARLTARPKVSPKTFSFTIA